MRYVLPPWVAVPVGIVTLACAGLAEVFGIHLGAANHSQGTTHDHAAIVIGLAVGLLVVWWATGLVLDEPFVLHRRDRAWLAVVGAVLALVAVAAGRQAAWGYVGIAVLLPLGAAWGLLVGRVAQWTTR